MKIFQIMLIINMLALINCQEDLNEIDKETNSKIISGDSIEPKSKEKFNSNEPDIVIVEFVDFSLGDASHYFFKEKSGKEWEFSLNEVDGFNFSQELSEAEANEENQGWQANKKYVGKWFKIKYEKREVELYPEGPMGEVLVIVDVVEIN